MRQWHDFPLPDGSYSDDTRPWSQQDVCNYLPTFAEATGTRSRIKYACSPGLQTIASVGAGPHRGAHDVEGRLFVVSGTALYQIAVDGTATSKGTIPGTGFVSMTHNQIDGGNQLVIGTGSNSYVYDTVLGTLTATGIPLLSVDFLNQRILGVDVGRRFWRYSGLADATSWNTLDNESAESSPDRIVGGCVSQGEWLVFGERTLEVWANSPTDDTAFQRGEVIERGCINANTIKRLDNTVFFVDNNFIPCRLNGYQPAPIAPKSIVSELSQCDPTKLLAYTWEDRGYVVYYITAQDGRTWGYDVTSGKWHRRQSFGLDRWRLNTLVKSNGDWYGGDYANGKLYKLTWGYAFEGCELMPRSLRTGVLHSTGNRLRIHGLRVLADTGRKASDIGAEATAPTIAGAMGNVVVGEAVSFQYTITRAFPGQDVTLTLVGALPTGLSIDSSGLVTGTPTTSGAFSWTITPSTDCATGVALADSATASTRAAYFDGAVDRLTTPFAAPIIASGDFTIEARVSASVVADYGIISGRNSNIRGWSLSIKDGKPTFRMSMNTGLIDTTDNLQGGAMTANQMTHIAITRSGDLFTLWQDGASIATYTNAGTIDEPSVTELAIGTSYSAIAESILLGYVDWIAVNIGTCRYTSSFTPPANAASVTGASIALDFNEPIGTTTFIDAGSLGKTWTTTGDVVIAEYPY